MQAQPLWRHNSLSWWRHIQIITSFWKLALATFSDVNIMGIYWFNFVILQSRVFGGGVCGVWCGGWWCGCGCLWGKGGVIKLCLPDLPRGFSGQSQPDGGWLPLDSLVVPFHFTAFVLPYSVLIYSDFSIAKVEIQLVSLRRQHTQGITCYFIFIFLMMQLHC